MNEPNPKAQYACDLLNHLTDSWTIDYAPEAFVLFFKDKAWLWEKIELEMQWK